MKKLLPIILLLCSFVSIGQTSINGARIQNETITTPKLAPGAVTEEKLAPSVGRPTDSGVLTAPYQLTFDKDVKKYSLAVNADIALSLASSGNVADSYIYIYATGNGTNNLSFPTDWKVTGTYNSAKVQRIFLEYIVINTIPKVLVTIEELESAIIPTLDYAAVLESAPDDLLLTFSEAVSITTAGWTLDGSEGSVTVASVVSGSGTASIKFDLSRDIEDGETLTVSYNPASGSTISSTGNEVSTILNRSVTTWDVVVIPDNVITVGPLLDGWDYETIQGAANASIDGSIIQIKGGTYRETIVPKEGVTDVTYQPFPGETVNCSCLDEAGNSGWTVHSGNIYKKTITLPQSTYSMTLTGNTTILNNQVFKDGVMMHEARYPNIDTPGDLMDLTKMRHRSSTANGFAQTSINDSGLPNSSSFNLTGAKLVAFGWFWPHTRIVSSHSGTTINYPSISSNDSYGQKYRQWYYVTGKLGLLNAAKEWHYEAGVLYFWQSGGGSPTGVEYKARNWAFDLRGRSGITIRGLNFIGCDIAEGNSSTANILIDNIRAKYMNHDVMYPDNFPGYGNAVTTATTSGMPEMGTKLLGSNNSVINSEFQYSASHVLWFGSGGLARNNLFEDISYDGAWGAPVSFWGLSDDVRFLYNTFSRTGRSGVDMGYSYTGNTQPQNLNIEVAYNDFSGWCSLNVDGGAIYSWGFRDLTGSKYHHNWFHDDGVVADPTGTKLDGGQRAVYFDQGTGPTTVHHNVFWNNFDVLSPNSMQDSQDIYSQMEFTGSSGYHRNTGGNFFYNNTIMSEYAHHSYATYETNSTKDVFRNNIFNKIINLEWRGGPSFTPNEQYNRFNREITNESSMTAATGSTKNVDFDNNFFLETGAGGLYYRLHASSTAKGTGVVIAGITPDGDATPNIGAYQDGDDWVPGYNEVALDDAIYFQDNNPSTTYTLAGVPFSPTVQTNPDVYSGNTSTFHSTTGGEITVTFEGTEFEWLAEKFKHNAIIEVQIDGVRQDCDPVTGGVQDCDLYEDTDVPNSQVVFTKSGLSGAGATHTFKAIHTGTKNASSEGYFVTHDAIKVITP